MADVTIYTLARELNMTPSMVSRAFNPDAKISEDKRKTVLEAAQRNGFTPNKFASRLSMKPVRIGVLINSRFQINTDKMIAGIREAHDRLKDYKIRYEITHLNPSANTEEEVRRALFQYRDFDGVILSGMSSAWYTPLINDFCEINPRVVQVQAINRDARCLFASKHDERVASSLAAEFLSSCLKRSARKNLLLFTGELSSALHASAANAFGEFCEALGLNLLATIDMKDSEDALSEMLPAVFGRYGDLTDGIYTTSGLSAPLCKYLEKSGADIPFVAFDTHSGIKEYMEKGIVTATIAQNVSNQSRVAFEMLVEYLLNGVECPSTVYTDVQLVLKSNMHQFN